MRCCTEPRPLRKALAVLGTLAMLGALGRPLRPSRPAAAVRLDSQLVAQRYAARLLEVREPKNVIFSYTISQAGPHDIEQTHRIYRSGENVRDETLSVDGQPLKKKITRIASYRDRYLVSALAPRIGEYSLLFLDARRDGNHYDYRYRTVALLGSQPFSVERITIDGATYLPSSIVFRTSNGSIVGHGRIGFARFGRYWMVTVASVTATVGGKPARERIAFSGYRFPASLPKSTFVPPKPLPTPALPSF